MEESLVSNQIRSSRCN